VQPVHRRPEALVAVALGGATGTALRDLAERARPAGAGDWPVATFGVNLLGALVLGALLAQLARSGPDTGRRQLLRLLVGTGFCGGLTTLSTLAVEVDLLLRDGHAVRSLAYLVASVSAGVAAAALGAALTGRSGPRPEVRP
jgi:CrcB protein